MAKRTVREFAAVNSANSRTARLLRSVANELQRLGVRWSADEDESTAFADWATWMAVPAEDAEYKAVTLKAPRGFRGCLLVHRAVLQS
jgi:hypothetical protein